MLSGNTPTSFPARASSPGVVPSDGSVDISLFRPLSANSLANLDVSGLPAGNQTSTVPSQAPVPTSGERCLSSFYRNFHAAHPFSAPREYLAQVASESALAPVLAAMRWIGSLYLTQGPARASFFEEAHRLAYQPDRPKDGFLVQALLLLVIGLDGNGRQEKAREILSDAERIAVDIGLNTRLFATLNGRGISVWEESWRRTWWELYTVDAMVAMVHRSTNFPLFDLACDVALPCEEYQYLTGASQLSPAVTCIS